MAGGRTNHGTARMAATRSQSPCTSHSSPASRWARRHQAHGGVSSPARVTRRGRPVVQWGPRRMPLRAHTSMSVRASSGSANHPRPGRRSKRSKRMGAAAE